MNNTVATLALGLAAPRSAQGVQISPRPAGQRSPAFRRGFLPPQQNVRVSRVGRNLFASPNAIKVGASSDHERNTPPGSCTRRFARAI